MAWKMRPRWTEKPSRIHPWKATSTDSLRGSLSSLHVSELGPNSDLDGGGFGSDPEWSDWDSDCGSEVGFGIGGHEARKEIGFVVVVILRAFMSRKRNRISQVSTNQSSTWVCCAVHRVNKEDSNATRVKREYLFHFYKHADTLKIFRNIPTLQKIRY